MNSTLRRSWRSRTTRALAVAAVLAGAAGGAAEAAELPADPLTFVQQFAAAQAGDAVVLATGDYGRFTGAQKPGMVTVRAAPGASASMSVDFRPASNITLDGLAITGLTIGNAGSKNITVRNSRFDRSQAVIRTGEVVDANILFDHNTHVGFDKCASCGEGRVFLPEKTGQPSGVTIQNSLFSGGNSDGIQNGGRAVRIVGNEFTGIHQVDGAEGVHADSIQLYGSAGTVIRGNYFHDVAVGVMAADGADHELIEDNVFAVSGSPYAVTLLSDDGSVFRHNTLLDSGICDYDQRCGVLYVGNKSADDASRGTVVTDNILSSVCVCDGSAKGFAQEDHNLFTNGSGPGASDLSGRPTYAGGTPPSTFAGFTLAAGSLGKGSASDGTDRGARIVLPSAPAPPPARSPAVGTTRAAPRLVAAYGFDERKGRVAADTSGTGNDGRIHGARRTRRGHAGRALAFDGRRDSVTVRGADSLNLTGGMTLEAWVRPGAGRRALRPVLVKRRGAGVAYGLYAGDRAGRPMALPHGARSAARARTRLPRRWTHLAVTYDGAALRLYVDGRLVSKRARPHALRSGAGPLRIGAGAARGGHFKGMLDDIRIYDGALGAGAIRRDMRRPV